MGLLDDAIREHLDLKRRRGADPAEIERAEREALGPVRREPLAGEEPAFEERSDVSSEPASESRPGADDDPTAAPGVAGRREEEFHDYDDDEEEEDGEGADDDEWEEYDDDEDWEEGDEPGAAGSERPVDPLNQPTELMPRAGAVPPPVPPDEPLAPPTPAPSGDVDPGPPADRRDDDQTMRDTASHEIEPEPPREERPGEGDVLEETPEFLQDTPDHDRLWFEQRPPRDFDFDN